MTQCLGVCTVPPDVTWVTQPLDVQWPTVVDVGSFNAPGLTALLTSQRAPQIAAPNGFEHLAPSLFHHPDSFGVQGGPTPTRCLPLSKMCRLILTSIRGYVVTVGFAPSSRHLSDSLGVLGEPHPLDCSVPISVLLLPPSRSSALPIGIFRVIAATVRHASIAVGSVIQPLLFRNLFAMTFVKPAPQLALVLRIGCATVGRLLGLTHSALTVPLAFGRDVERAEGFAFMAVCAQDRDGIMVRHRGTSLPRCSPPVVATNNAGGSLRQLYQNDDDIFSVPTMGAV